MMTETENSNENKDPEITFGLKRSQRIYSEDLNARETLAVLKNTKVDYKILRLSNSPTLDLSRARTESAVKPSGNSLTMKFDYFSSMIMEEYLQKELMARGNFKDYKVCDVGIWDANASTDDGLRWHNDYNWNGFLRPDNRSFHGWFVNSYTDDCNFTLAVSTDSKYNECNASTRTKIFYIASDDVIKPDVIMPLEKNILILFPYGAAHRTYIHKEPNRLTGRRLVTSFVFHHKGDVLDENKISDLTDDQLCAWLDRYPIEKSMESNHYIIKLIEEHPRIGPLMEKLLENFQNRF